MTPEQVLAIPPKILTQAQREFYFEQGYLLAESIIPMDWVEKMRAVTDEWVEKSRALTQSDAMFDLEDGHSAQEPRLRRLSMPNEHDERYWAFATSPALLDLVEDLVGPDIKFHHSKLNFKWPEGGEEVKWHQDIQFWPHTNYSPLTVGTYLHDVGPDQGPLGVVPGSHEGELYDEYNDKDEWTGCLSDADCARAQVENGVYLMGPAGSVTVHNCRTIHGSRPNVSARGRPLLLNVYSAADAFSYTYNPLGGRYGGAVVRGKPARYARHDPRPCQVPPDWSGGYTSIFALQQEEDWDESALEAVASQTAELHRRISQGTGE